MTYNADKYAFADALGVTLDVEGDKIRCQTQQPVAFGNLRVPVPFSIVSSLLSQDGSALLCRSVGNLAMLAVTKYKPDVPVTLFVLDLAKMNSKPNNLIEDRKYTCPQHVVDGLKEAIVQVFDRTKANGWSKSAV
jgi:hypothetical protein